MEELIVDDINNDLLYGVQIFNEIIPPNFQGKGGLYLGRVHLVKRPEQLKKMRIGAILSVIEYPVEIDPKQKITHKCISIEDDPDKNLAQHFEETFKFISENLKKTNVYVHCAMGISRSSTIVIAYLMKLKKGTFENTLKFVQSKRDCVDPNDGFQEQLKAYEKLILKK